MNIKFIIATLLLLTSCAELPMNLSTETLYRRDLALQVDGAPVTGIAVLPAKDEYRITVETKAKIDLLTITTCHREITQEKATAGFFGTSNKYEWQFVPTLMEKTYCPIEITTFEASKGRHAWAFLDRHDAGMNLPAKLNCNGVETAEIGVSICQSRAGLYQKIIFDEAVKYIASEGCPIATSDKKAFTYQLNKGNCLYIFSNGQTKHRHTAFGYESIVIREQ